MGVEYGVEFHYIRRFDKSTARRLKEACYLLLPHECPTFANVDTAALGLFLCPRAFIVPKLSSPSICQKRDIAAITLQSSN